MRTEGHLGPGIQKPRDICPISCLDQDTRLLLQAGTLPGAFITTKGYLSRTA